MQEIRWSHDFVCATRESEVVCNAGSEYSRVGRAGYLRGNKLVASKLHRQITDPEESWSSEGVDYSPLKLQSSVGNIIGCFLNERTGTIRCVEGENTEDGRKEVISEIELWMKIERGG